MKRRLWLVIPALLLVAALLPAAYVTGRALHVVATFDPHRYGNGATLFDQTGRIIATLGQKHREYIPFDEIPATLRNATVAIEDKRFYHHPAIDPIAILRAVTIDLLTHSAKQGASTITQQVAKNLFLTPRKSLARKGEEAIMALVLERRFTKDQILAIYINHIYYGAGAYGIEAAAQTYFGKDASALTLAESALLAGLAQAPSAYSPFTDQQAARRRQRVVLDAMADQGYITRTDVERAAAEPLRLNERPAGLAPYFVDAAAAELVERFGHTLTYEGGLRVQTTLRPQMQKAADAALGDHQGAIVALDPKSGAVWAMVGGRSYEESPFNRATEAFRQPGSALKPFVYAAALERGWSTNRIVNDFPHEFDGYAPSNFANEYFGYVTMSLALAHSLNNATVWLLERIGVDPVIRLLNALGIKLTPADRHLALALGGLSKGVTPLHLTDAYTAFANQGVFQPYHLIERVTAPDGKTLFNSPANGGRRVISPETAYMMANMLKGVVRYGTGPAAGIAPNVAGKTGTTDDLTNAWFIGFTPDLVAGVYVGEDLPTNLHGGGGTLAAPIWATFARSVLPTLPKRDFPRPKGVTPPIAIDPFNGKLADKRCAWVEYDVFRTGREPKQASPCESGTPQPKVPLGIMVRNTAPHVTG